VIPVFDGCSSICAGGQKLYTDPVTRRCSCVPDPPQKGACLAVTSCGPDLSPQWDYESSSCVCPPQVRCSSAKFCSSRSFPVWNNNSSTCNCKTLPELCSDLVCIATTNPSYNATSGKCYCAPIKQLPPVTLPTLNSRDVPTTLSTTTDPTATEIHLSCEALKIYCECGDHKMHLNEHSGKCECPVCPSVALGPPCKQLEVWCEAGDHYMHLDPITHTCKCPPVES
jgi:hypothetical protein